MKQIRNEIDAKNQINLLTNNPFFNIPTSEQVEAERYENLKKRNVDIHSDV